MSKSTATRDNRAANAAATSAKRGAKAAAAAKAFTENAPRFVQLVKDAAGAAGTLKRLRPELEHLARLMWSKPVTVAEAAKGLNLDLSVKDQPKDSPQRGEIQRQRVTLARALNDAELLLKDATKGRKSKPAGESDKPEAEKLDTTRKMAQVDVVLAAIPHLNPAELERVAEAVSARLMASIATDHGTGPLVATM